MLDIYTLEQNAAYLVKRDFTDFYGNAFTSGEVLTYVERHFLPYTGGHTLVFRERHLYLQEEVNKEIIEAFAEYLRHNEET
jgi:hypothetical protein